MVPTERAGRVVEVELGAELKGAGNKVGERKAAVAVAAEMLAVAAHAVAVRVRAAAAAAARMAKAAAATEVAVAGWDRQLVRLAGAAGGVETVEAE